MKQPVRGFTVAEFKARLQRAQDLMARHDLAGLLLTTEPEVRYFTGFLTRFWQSPTRPWFVIVPASGEPVAVIPSIGVHLMQQGWLRDIRSWTSPDLYDDGISLVADALTELCGTSGRVGLPMGHETHLRLPLADFSRLQDMTKSLDYVDDGGIMRQLRLIKSAAEIEKVAYACHIAGKAFARLREIAAQGTSLDAVFRQFQILCLEEGADWVPYLAGGAGPGGYGDVISPATARPLKKGDCLMLDTGLVWDGYFCDFDRNFSVGPSSAVASAGYQRLLEATDAGQQAARPGARACDVYQAMKNIVGSPLAGGDPGRLGHGLGMQLTEWPSFIADDQTILAEGMVITLEPGIEVAPGVMLVHEDNFVIEEKTTRMLSPPAPSTLTVI